MAVKVKHNKTGNGTHEQRVNIFKAQLKAQRKAADFLQGRHDLLKQVPMLTDGSKYDVSVVDEQNVPSGAGGGIALGSTATGTVGVPTTLLTEEQALEEVEAMSSNYGSQLSEEEALNEVEEMASNFSFKMQGTGVVGVPETPSEG